MKKSLDELGDFERGLLDSGVAANAEEARVIAEVTSYQNMDALLARGEAERLPVFQDGVVVGMKIVNIKTGEMLYYVDKDTLLQKKADGESGLLMDDKLKDQ